jgi:hypothetical protein
MNQVSAPALLRENITAVAAILDTQTGCHHKR